MLVRHAKKEDLHAVGKLALGLVRLHESFDPKRFMRIENPDRGYERFLAREIESDEACVMVVEVDGEVVGYTYATLEERDYNALLDACAKLHDIFVREDMRGKRAGEALLDATVAALKKMGAPRIVLYAATQNEGAQKLFAKKGFRPTMVELTRDL